MFSGRSRLWKTIRSERASLFRSGIEFNRLPFGLSNSPANFKRLMDTVLKELIGDEFHVSVDDVVFSRTAKEYAARLEHVLELFDTKNLQRPPQKCAFAQPKLNYVGYVLW